MYYTDIWYIHVSLQSYLILITAVLNNIIAENTRRKKSSTSGKTNIIIILYIYHYIKYYQSQTFHQQSEKKSKLKLIFQTVLARFIIYFCQTLRLNRRSPDIIFLCTTEYIVILCQPTQVFIKSICFCMIPYNLNYSFELQKGKY